MSTAASSNFRAKADQLAKSTSGLTVLSMRDGIPDIVGGEEEVVCILVSPSSRQDYMMARQLASSGQVNGVVLINGVTKVRKMKGVKSDYYSSPDALTCFLLAIPNRTPRV